jgi:hypothetical protein
MVWHLKRINQHFDSLDASLKLPATLTSEAKITKLPVALQRIKPSFDEV